MKKCFYLFALFVLSYVYTYQFANDITWPLRYIADSIDDPKERKKIFWRMREGLTPGFASVSTGDYPDENQSFRKWFSAKFDGLNALQKDYFDKKFEVEFPIINEKINLAKHKIAADPDSDISNEMWVFTEKYHYLHFYFGDDHYISKVVKKQQEKYKNLSIEEIIEANIREDFAFISSKGLRISELLSSYKYNKDYKPSKIIKIENLDFIN